MRPYPNILPPEKKDTLRLGLIMAYLQTVVMFVFITAFFVGGILFSVRMIYAGNDEALKQSTTESDGADDAATEIQRLNAYLKRIDGITADAAAWSDRLAEFGRAVPAGIQLQNVSFSPSSKINIIGLAAHRDDLLLLQERLARLSYVKEVSSPLSNLFQKKDVKFEINMTVKPPTPAAK